MWWYWQQKTSTFNKCYNYREIIIEKNGKIEIYNTRRNTLWESKIFQNKDKSKYIKELSEKDINTGLQRQRWNRNTTIIGQLNITQSKRTQKRYS